MTTTNDDPRALLEEAEKLDAEATPGPWEWLHGCLRGAHLHFGCSDGCKGDDPDDRSYVIDGENVSLRDLEFLARARTLVPQLASALRAALDELHDQSERLVRAAAECVGLRRERDTAQAEVEAMREAVEAARSSLPKCSRCDAAATHWSFDATSDAFPTCAEHGRIHGGMDGDEEPIERPAITRLANALRALDARGKGRTR